MSADERTTIQRGLDEATKMRAAVNGAPEYGPYPASTDEVADEIVSWVKHFEEHAHGLAAAVAYRLGVPHPARREACSECDGWGCEETPAVHDWDGAYLEPPGQGPCGACLGSGMRVVQEMYAALAALQLGGSS